MMLYLREYERSLKARKNFTLMVRKVRILLEEICKKGQYFVEGRNRLRKILP
jgi:hypothetical protein